MSWAVKVTGDPAPKGSLKCIGARGRLRHVLVEDNKRTKPWRDRVKLAGFRLIERAGGPLTGALAVELTLTLPRPKSHYRTGQNAGVIRDSALPEWPTSHARGDVDKHARTVLDGLGDAGLFADDSQVVQLTTVKVYVNQTGTGSTDVLPEPGAVIRVTALGEGSTDATNL